MLSFFYIFFISVLPVYAGSLPQSEMQALTEYPNWVVCGGGTSDTSSSGSGAASATPKGGVSFDDTQSSDTGGQTTIDDDGVDPSPTGSSDHQSSTSYADGRLGALHTNYIALNPGWASSNGLALGDIAALTYKGKTVYAVYGDNHVGNTPHAEISVRAAMSLTGINNPAKVGSLSGVHFTIYPGTHSQLNGSVDQSKIDQIGAQVSGAGNASSGTSSSAGGGGSCSCSASDNFGPGILPSYVKEPYNKIFTAAAAKFKIDPAALVAIFYTENYGYTQAWSAFQSHDMKAPPPPYGNGAPWPVSSANAQGPFQFIPGTWSSAPPVDGNGDGKADPADLTDAAFTAAEGFSNGLFGGVKLTTSSSASDVAQMAGHYYGDGLTSPGSYGGVAGQIFAQIKKDEGSGGGGAPSQGSTDSSSTGSGCGGSQSTGSCSGGGTTVTGDAAILCEAKQYNGIYYLFAGAHAGYSSFRQACPASSISSAAAKSTAGNPGPCATDCSGLVSVSVDQAFNQNFMWSVDGSGHMTGSGSEFWKPVSVTQAQPGDIVTMPGHVEIVDHVSGGTIYTFGSHHTGAQTGGIQTSTSYWTGGAWHWTGPGSGG